MSKNPEVNTNSFPCDRLPNWLYDPKTPPETIEEYLKTLIQNQDLENKTQITSDLKITGNLGWVPGEPGK